MSWKGKAERHPGLQMINVLRGCDTKIMIIKKSKYSSPVCLDKFLPAASRSELFWEENHGQGGHLYSEDSDGFKMMMIIKLINNDMSSAKITMGEQVRPSPSMSTTSFPWCTRSATSRASLIITTMIVMIMILAMMVIIVSNKTTPSSASASK